MSEYCKCGSMLNPDKTCSNKRCPDKQSQQTSWIVGGELTLYRQAVTFAEAVKLKAEGSKLIIKLPGKDNQKYMSRTNGTW